jgi:hypothetical protein
MSDEIPAVDTEDVEIASEDDFRVQRDDDGELLPVKSRIEGMEKYIVHYPMTRGQANEFLPENAKALELMSDAQIAALINECLIKPDFGTLTADDIDSDDWKAFLDPATIVETIADASGYGTVRAQNAKMTAEMLENTDEGKLEKLGEQMKEATDSTED